METHTNSLINASSPYLLQHAHNPVNWQEWSDTIREQALREDKLILISIGYSSCHWCHVMAHECFEKEDTAAIMNEHFICVKIDREERPDIDQIYMDAVQLITGRGGWPLNVFTLPDGSPLHGGTYFPKANWEQTLLGISKFYKDKKEEAWAFANKLSAGIKNLDHYLPEKQTKTPFEIVSDLLEKWKLQFDPVWGGYNWAPKFPLPNQWELYLLHASQCGKAEFAEASRLTLKKMYEGGIYDHLAGGFSRYATDSIWKVPHFEKMLYDNAQLMGTYAFAARFFAEPLFAEVCNGIHQFLQNELRSKEGLYYSALDADSEGIEGKFYVWSYDEIQECLPKQANLFCQYFNITPEPNWEEGNILHITQTREEIAQQAGITTTNLNSILEESRKLLLLERSKRVRPGLDDKVICGWNALLIKGYAKAFHFLQEEDYRQEAVLGIDRLLAACLVDDQLYRILKNGRRSVHAFAEDYAALIDALIAVFEISGQDKYLHLASRLMEICIREFGEEKSGLFYFTPVKQTELVTRKIEVNDDVIPSSNSILAHCLYKLSFYCDRPDWDSRWRNMLDAVLPRMQKFPNGFSNWMQLVVLEKTGFRQIIMKGPEAKNWERELRKNLLINCLVISPSAFSEIPFLTGKVPPDGITQAWICIDRTCDLPISNLEEVIKMLTPN